MKKTFTLLLILLCLSFSNTTNAQDSYLGDIKLTAVNFAQTGWMECAGQILPISQNTALFSLLGTQYGGNGMTTFALPDLSGRVPIGQGSGPGLPTYNQGSKGGTDENTISINQMPTHTHPVNAVIEDGNQSVPTGNLPAGTKVLDKEYSSDAQNTTMKSSMIGNQGGGQPVNNMQPYLTLRYVICVQGIFPSRP